MNRTNRIFAILGLFLFITTLSCKKETLQDKETVVLSQWGNAIALLPNDVIIEWSNIALEAAGGAAEAHPLLASRNEAMMHIAIHDALNAIVPLYQNYAYKPQQPCTSADPFAAAASAAHTVLKASWPDSAAMFDAKLAAFLSTIPDGPAKTQGIELGAASGNAILALRANDGAYQNPISDWSVSDVPGVYNIVPPYTFVYAPFWKTMQSFSLKANDQFRSPPPPTLTSSTYTKDYNEVKRFGKLKSTDRTTEQTTYANFWYELSNISWNRIARTQATDNHTGLYTTARMFALLNMALADSYTSGWDSKFYYNFWRPYTAIRAAATDGNGQTKPNVNWDPLLITPPVPDYPSTHSVLGNAAATVLTHFFGENTAFSATSTTSSVPGAVRNFKSFKQAANENADSRVMAGIHFRSACDAGQKMGNKVGKWTVDNYLKPLD